MGMPCYFTFNNNRRLPFGEYLIRRCFDLHEKDISLPIHDVLIGFLCHELAFLCLYIEQRRTPRQVAVESLPLNLPVKIKEGQCIFTMLCPKRIQCPKNSMSTDK